MMQKMKKTLKKKGQKHQKRQKGQIPQFAHRNINNLRVSLMVLAVNLTTFLLWQVRVDGPQWMGAVLCA